MADGANWQPNLVQNADNYGGGATEVMTDLAARLMGW